ncbi:MAG: tyrosine-type recombinase/integrase [Pseudomonadota bacterium]
MAHNLRHSFAVDFLEQGGSLKALQEMLGHDEFKTTSDTYAHVTEDHLQKAVNLVKLGPLDLLSHKK